MCVYVYEYLGSISSSMYISLKNIDIFYLHILYMSFPVAAWTLWYPAEIGR